MLNQKKNKFNVKKSINDNMRVRGNISIKYRDRHCESKAGEIIRKIDIMNHLE